MSSDHGSDDERSESDGVDGERPGDGIALDRRGFVLATGAAASIAAGAGRASTNAYSTHDLTISSFDGTDLAATLYTPDDGQAHPAVLMTHGWGSDRTGERVIRKADNYASNGYVVLTYDSRGFGESGGVVGLNGPNEVGDVSALIDWVAARDEVVTDGPANPRLGMDGYSYSGAIQLLAAAEDDRIDAVVPRITWNDMEYATAPNGVVKVGWLTLLLAAGAVSTWEWDSGPGLDGDLWSWYLGAVVDNELPADASAAFAERSVSEKIDQVDAPALLVQAWDDALFNTNEALRTYRDLQARGVETRIALYEGGHSLAGLSVPSSVREHLNGLALDWMDEHLKGADVTVPQSSVYLKQPETWREDDQFPPSHVGSPTLNLADAADDDDTHLEKGWWWWQDSSTTFRWVASQDLEIVGRPEFSLWVHNDGPESRLFFEFFHVNEEGERQLINDVGESYRVDGQGYQHVEFDFPAFQRFVAEDDYIELDVSISNPFYLDSRESDGVSIMHSEEYPSTFDLPYHYVGGSVMDAGATKSFGVGDEVHAAVDEVPVRTGPGTGYGVIVDKHVHASGVVLGGPVSADGQDWWDVHWYEDGEGFRGWVAQEHVDRGPRTTERLTVGDRVYVDGVNLNVREGPSLEHTSLAVAADDSEGRIVAGPVWAQGDSTEYVWWKIAYDDYPTGWSAQDYLSRP